MTTGAHLPAFGWSSLRAAGAALAALLLAAAAVGQPSREYDLKAVFLYNFATFVDWPESAFPGPDTPFVIGVLGDDPFGAALDEIVAGERVKNRPLAVRRCRDLAEARACHILFISASERDRLREVLRDMAGRPILTVADVPRFVESGGMIGFSTGARVQLHVNAGAVRNSGLTISSKLLRVAVVREVAATP
ncbi:MAG TPA: YfiR family protein [Opitutaceae bacterium]|nr:YfiR family protein [Opitutaceae bacterium]